MPVSEEKRRLPELGKRQGISTDSVNFISLNVEIDPDNLWLIWPNITKVRLGGVSMRRAAAFDSGCAQTPVRVITF